MSFRELDPKGFLIIGYHHIERPVPLRINISQRIGGGFCVRMVECLERQFTSASETLPWAQESFRFKIAATTPRSFMPSQVPPANWSWPAMTSCRSCQWRAGGYHGRSNISSRLAAIRDRPVIDRADAKSRRYTFPGKIKVMMLVANNLTGLRARHFPVCRSCTD